MNTTKSTITKNDAGFRGRQWESSVTGQQYSTKREAMEAEAKVAEFAEKIAAFLREQGR